MQMSCEVTRQFCFRYTDHDSSSNSYMAVQSNLCHNCYAIHNVETEETDVTPRFYPGFIV